MVVVCGWVCPFSEKLARYISRFRRLERKRDKEKLYPLFAEVRGIALKSDRAIKSNTLLYLHNVSDINAYALGKRSVCITKGSMSFMNDEEIKGMFAHELGHLSGRHSMALQLVSIASFPFNMLVRFVHFLVDPLDRNEKSIFNGILKLYKTLCLLPFTVLEYLIKANSRTNEYEADKYAFSLGYGEGLISALYKLSDMNNNESGGLFSWLSNSHPHLYARIERLERLEEQSNKV